jgi:hypothetical protein
VSVNNASSGARPPLVFLWIVILGAVGFLAGFVGPMILAPDANQGPLVGIFISGPGGVILGAILLLITRVFRISAERQWLLLWITSAVLAIATLVSVMPSPQFIGYIVEAQIQGCAPPAQSADDGIAYWEKRVASVTWASPRPGWQDEARLDLREDVGVVLDVVITRHKGIYEGRKLWNKGRLLTRGWIAVDEKKKFYARSASGTCAEFTAGTRVIDFVAYDYSVKPASAADWPPREIPNFLNLQTIAAVPDEYQRFSGN